MPNIEHTPKGAGTSGAGPPQQGYDQFASSLQVHPQHQQHWSDPVQPDFEQWRHPSQQPTPGDRRMIFIPSYALFSGGLKDDAAGLEGPEERNYSSRSYAKQGHTKLCNKLLKQVDSAADPQVVIEGRQILREIACEFLDHHTEYVSGLGIEASKEQRQEQDKYFDEVNDAHKFVTKKTKRYLQGLMEAEGAAGGASSDDETDPQRATESDADKKDGTKTTSYQFRQPSLRALQLFSKELRT